MNLFQRLCCIFCISAGFSLNAIAEPIGVIVNPQKLEACRGKPLVVGNICAIYIDYLNYCDFTKQIVPIKGGSLDGLFACVIGKAQP